ncbi:MAG: crotonase [Gammaproteobacteria bacterium]|nr:crotonase [Gammaproteobacteria bacterium]
MTHTQTSDHWRMERDNDDIAWLYFSRKDSSVNTLSTEALTELDDLLTDLAKNKPKGLIILSAKESGFIAGADVKEISSKKTIEDAAEFIRLGQAVFDRLENIDCPTVALISGFCLGGGLELALACRYRIAEDDPKTKLGLPEVKLGIHPAFGGTVRLPPLIGAPAAMDLMLSGRAISARAAQKTGLVDYAVPKRHLLEAARRTILKPPAPHKPKRWQAMTNHRLVRPWLAKVFRKKVAAKAPEKHYPAPYAIIDLWQKYADTPGRMLREERASEAQLVTDETAQNLIRLFFLQERMKSLGNKDLIDPKHIHVIGGGVMGGDIAVWCALCGFTVTLQDHKHETIANVMQRAHKLFKKKLKLPRLITAATDRLIPDITGSIGLSQADVIIEAIFEDINAKHALFKEIESKIKPDALLATNTSSIPIEDLAKVLSKPERLVGLHFFNPVALMQLVEIVCGTDTDQAVIDKASAFARHIDRLPVPVKSTPGFLVNRILMPYLIEAVVLESEGVPASVIDKAALDYGMPMGPIELADTVGLDICLHVAENLSQAYHVDIPERLKNLVKAGNLGKKTGNGFYHYNKKKGGKKQQKKSGDSNMTNDEICDRMIMKMLNESIACLREQVVEDADLLDAGIVYGTGFAPFRGGPMNYIEKEKKAELKDKLSKLTEKYGDRFTPDAGWSN